MFEVDCGNYKHYVSELHFRMMQMPSMSRQPNYMYLCRLVLYNALSSYVKNLHDDLKVSNGSNGLRVIFKKLVFLAKNRIEFFIYFVILYPQFLSIFMLKSRSLMHFKHRKVKSF